jgi:hypothetical protein
MKSRKPKLLEAGHPDNFQTPASALDPLLPYLNKYWTIWEPSSGKGQLARGLESAGFKVVSSDRDKGFLNWRPENFDAIVGNPPYSAKAAFLARCYDLYKPFALLLPITVFDSMERRRMFHEYGVQVIFPHGRIHYETPNHEARAAVGKKSSAWFYSIWVCWNLPLPSLLVFSGIESQPSLISAA